MAVSDPQERYESINLIEVWLIVWQHKWFVLAASAIVVGISLVYVFNADSWYRAEVLLKAVDNKASQGLTGQLGGLGSLAGLAGISLSSGNSAEPIAVLTSREFTAAFIEEQDLLPVLFHEKWDAANKRWKTPNVQDQPDIRDAVKFFDKTVRSVQEDKKTGFIRLSIQWTDPKVAAAWTNLLVARVNETMRNRALAEAEANVAFLKTELASSSIVTMQQSIGRVLENELQKLMLARANKEYAFKILDHAQPPKWRSFPQRSLIVASALFSGFAIAVFFLLARHAVRRNRALAESISSHSAVVDRQ
jgi:uncharacterized protein involved in exopolysaccharide biosynthesis